MLVSCRAHFSFARTLSTMSRMGYSSEADSNRRRAESVEEYSQSKISSKSFSYILPRFMQRLLLKVKPEADSLAPDLKILLDKASVQLYFDCANRFPYLKLCSSFGLPDYMSSWYKLTLMHIWMVLLRLHISLDAHAYFRLQKGLLATMWLDIDKRLDVVGREVKQRLTSSRDMRSMHGLHLQTFLEYDEGFLSDDVTLAASIWRCLYLQRTFDSIHIIKAVEYIRFTVTFLDTLDINDILVDGIKQWKGLEHY